MEGNEWKGLRTGISLYAGGDLTWANLIKKGDVLAEDGSEVELANTLSGHLRVEDPDTHVNVSGGEHTHAWGKQS